MGKIVPCRSVLVCYNLPRATLTAILAGCLLYALLGTAAVHALDEKKHLTQYMHTAWRTQDGSLPAGMFSITQTSDGFLWFLSLPGDVYRFDGVRFLPWRFPADVSNGPIAKIFADQAGGLWVIGDELVHLKDGVVTAHFALEGLQQFQIITEDPDGSLWVALRASSAPLCHVTDRTVKCFGKDDGIPISRVNSLLADGKGGFWLGGEGTLVHWHAGVSETYNAGKYDLASLARGPDGTLWVGTDEGLGLARFKDGGVKPFVTPTFDGSRLNVTSMLFDRDGNLFVGDRSGTIFKIDTERKIFVHATLEASISAYHLAVVVDDAFQGVTLVTRGNDLFGATHVQRLLQSVLGLPAPRYAHHRLILDSDGRKLSKRERATTLRSLRDAGRSASDIRATLGV